MSKHYKATSPEDLARFFDRMAVNEGNMEEIAATQRGKLICRSRAVAWRDAANLIRETEFVGWEPKP